LLGRFWKWLALMLAALLLGGAYGVTGHLNRSRESLGLVQASLPNEARPDLLTNVLLSAGRALAVDYLWIGAMKLHEEGRHFDAMQRAEWICQLQPRFPSVWIFHAWNMAYNISVTMTTGQERWLWVQNGFKLLRDRGIPLNPKSLGLYQQLAWIFFHKIGGLSDDQHWYYKIKLAEAMEDILGWPDPDYEAIAAAPSSWEELVEDPQVAQYVKAFADMNIDVRREFWTLLKTPREELGSKVLDLLQDRANHDARRKLEAFLRAQRLRAEWRMDPALVGQLRGKDMFGPLDFRTPQAHAIYWAIKGFKAVGQDVSFDALGALWAAEENRGKRAEGMSFEALSLARIIRASMQELVRRGRFVITEAGVPIASPDLRFIETTHRIHLALGKADMGEDWDGTAGPTFRSAHVNFLRKAVARLYQYGRNDLARHYWRILKKLYPNKEYDVPMETYVHKYILEDMGGVNMPLDAVTSAVGFYLTEAYRRYAIGDDYSAVAMQRLAETIYQAYMEEQRKRLSLRVKLPPLDDIKRDARRVVLANLPPKLADRLRSRLGLSAPSETQSPQGQGQ